MIDKPTLEAGDKALALRSSDHTRQKLLKAAQNVFVERGFYDASVRVICDRAGLNVAMVNYHFGDKLGLYTEVLKSSSPAARPELLGHVDDPDADPVALLRNLIAMFLQNMRETNCAFDVFIRQERLRPTPAMQYLIETSMRPAYQATCALVGRILNLPAEDEKTRLATHAVVAQVKHFGEPERLLTQLDPAILSGKTIEDLADIIVGFFLAAFRTAHPPSEGIRKNPAVNGDLKKRSGRLRR